MTMLARICALSAAVVLAAAGLSCDDAEPAPHPSCESGCAATEVCWYGRNICVPKPDETGTCPDGYVYAECATGSCPRCRDCVEACLPSALAQ